jgi:hypothetical protein
MEPIGPFVGVGLWLLDRVRDLVQAGRRVRVQVHRASFLEGHGPSVLTMALGPRNVSMPATGIGTPLATGIGPPPVTGYAGPKAVSEYYFVKVVNLSRQRTIQITHVWFETNPRLDLLIPERPLPAWLRPDEEWEGWVNAAGLPHDQKVEWLGRVRLSSGKVIKSRLNKDVPPRGYVSGAGSR